MESDAQPFDGCDRENQQVEVIDDRQENRKILARDLSVTNKALRERNSPRTEEHLSNSTAGEKRNCPRQNH